MLCGEKAVCGPAGSNVVRAHGLCAFEVLELLKVAQVLEMLLVAHLNCLLSFRSGLSQQVCSI